MYVLKLFRLPPSHTHLSPRHSHTHILIPLPPTHTRTCTPTHTHTHTHSQGYSLAVSLVMVLANLVYFEPQTSRCVAAKHVLEKEQQAGNTIGKIDDDKMEILKKNEKYVALDKRFFLLHSLSSIANLVALSAQAIHLWHIAGHLSTI